MSPSPAPAAPARLSTDALKALRIDRGAASPARRRRRWPWVVGALLVAGGAVLMLRPRAPAVQLVAVQAAYPSQQYVRLTASGYVVAQRRAAVSSKATGRLIELTVREGSVVKSGDLIGRIEAADVAASIAAADAGIAQAVAGERQARAGTAQAQAELTQAESDLRRSDGLVAQGFISPQALDSARSRVASARAAVAAAEAAQGVAQAAAAAARAQRLTQQVNRDNTEIRAPFDGVVLQKNANVGDLITPFSSASGTSGAVVTMADMSTLEVEADVSESNVGQISPDQPVEITLDALPDARFRGSVARIVPTVDRAKATVMTKVRFSALDARILPEMSAKVFFLSQPATDADQRPVTAVNPRTLAGAEGAKQVWRVATGDVAEAVPVTVGRTLGDLVEVRGALKAGDRLVLDPPAALKAGQAVSVAGK